MNERIKQLAEQANIQIVKATNYATALAEQGQLKDLEKFAELIVQECVTNLYLNGYDDAVIQIQKHFGVEE
jgi:hypothetical protein